jgi:hypothetical protein
MHYIFNLLEYTNMLLFKLYFRALAQFIKLFKDSNKIYLNFVEIL